MRNFRKKNLEKIREYDRERHKKNIEKRREQDRIYHIKNKEKRNEMSKRYREKNKERLSNYSKEKILCECGKYYTRKNKLGHEKTKYHLQNINNENLNL